MDYIIDLPEDWIARCRAQPHRFVLGQPTRIEIGQWSAYTCNRSRTRTPLWWAGHRDWKRLPNQFRDLILCVDCYRHLLPTPPAMDLSRWPATVTEEITFVDHVPRIARHEALVGADCPMPDGVLCTGCPRAWTSDRQACATSHYCRIFPPVPRSSDLAEVAHFLAAARASDRSSYELFCRVRRWLQKKALRVG